MLKSLSSLFTHLFVLPCCVALAQSPKPETYENTADTAKTATYDLADTADLPQVHVIELKNADAKELSESFGKIFDTNIKSGQLAIVGDSRAKRLVVRATDQIYRDVQDLIQILDMPSPPNEVAVVASSATAASQPFGIAEASAGDNESIRRIGQQIKDSAKDPSRVASLQKLLQEAVQRDFEDQQRELRTDLSKLRLKMDSLEALLEKRETQKNSIILRRIQNILNSEESGPLPTKDPYFIAPATRHPVEAKGRTSPFHTNISLDPSSFADEITVILQAELQGEDGMQIVLDGKPTSLSTTVPFQLSNTADKVEFEIASNSNNRAFVAVKLECVQASEEFWKRIVLEKIRLNISQDELERVSGNQMITKCIYLPKEPGKGLTWLVWDQVDAGVDVREKSKELGQPVVTMTLTRLSTSGTLR